MAQTTAGPDSAAPAQAAVAAPPAASAAAPAAEPSARGAAPYPSPQAAAMRSRQLLSASPPAHVPVRG